MDGMHVRRVITFARMPGMAAENYQAVSRQAQNSGHLGISRALNKKAKLGSVPIKVIAQEFLLRGRPIIQVKAVLAATSLKNLISASSNYRLDNLLMLLPATLDCNYPVVGTLSGLVLHSRTSFLPQFPNPHASPNVPFSGLLDHGCPKTPWIEKTTPVIGLAQHHSPLSYAEELISW
jgi:hypothetical protein